MKIAPRQVVEVKFLEDGVSVAYFYGDMSKSIKSMGATYEFLARSDKLT